MSVTTQPERMSIYFEVHNDMWSSTEYPEIFAVEVSTPNDFLWASTLHSLFCMNSFDVITAVFDGLINVVPKEVEIISDEVFRTKYNGVAEVVIDESGLLSFFLHSVRTLLDNKEPTAVSERSEDLEVMLGLKPVKSTHDGIHIRPILFDSPYSPCIPNPTQLCNIEHKDNSIIFCDLRLVRDFEYELVHQDELKRCIHEITQTIIGEYNFGDIVVPKSKYGRGYQLYNADNGTSASVMFGPTGEPLFVSFRYDSDKTITNNKKHRAVAQSIEKILSSYPVLMRGEKVDKTVWQLSGEDLGKLVDEAIDHIPPIRVTRNNLGNIVSCDIEITVDDAAKEDKDKVQEILNKLASIAVKAYGHYDALDENGNVFSTDEDGDEIHILGTENEECIYFFVAPSSDVVEFVLHYDARKVTNQFVKDMVREIVCIVSESDLFPSNCKFL